MGWLQSQTVNSDTNKTNPTKQSNDSNSNPNSSVSTLNHMKTIHEKIKYLQSLSERDKKSCWSSHYGSVDNLYQELDELETSTCTCECDNLGNEQQEHSYESIYGRQQRHYNNNPSITKRPSYHNQSHWIQDGLISSSSRGGGLFSTSNPLNNSNSEHKFLHDSSKIGGCGGSLLVSDDSAHLRALQFSRDQVVRPTESTSQNIIDSRSLRRNSTAKHKGPSGILNRRLSSDLNGCLSSSTLSLSRLDILEEEQSLTLKTSCSSKKKSERSTTNSRNPNPPCILKPSFLDQQQLNGIWLDSRNRRELISQESCPTYGGLLPTSQIQQKSSTISSRILSPHRVPSSKRTSSSSSTSRKIPNSITSSQRNNCCLDVLQLQPKNSNSFSNSSSFSPSKNLHNVSSNNPNVNVVPTVSGLICSSSPKNKSSYSYELNEYCICPTSAPQAPLPENRIMSTNLNIRDFESPTYEEISKIYNGSPQRHHYPHQYLQHVIMNTQAPTSSKGFGGFQQSVTPSPRKIVPKQSYKPGIYLPSSCLVDKDEIYDYIPPMKEPESLSPSKSTPRRLKLQKSSSKNPIELTHSSSTLYNTNRKSKLSNQNQSPSHRNLDFLTASAENTQKPFDEGIQQPTNTKIGPSGPGPSSSTNRTFISLSKLGRRLGLTRLFRSFRIQSRGARSQAQTTKALVKQSNQTNNGNISTLIIKSRNPNGSCGKGLSSTDASNTSGTFGGKGSVSCSGPISGMSSLPSNERIIETINRLKYEELQKRKERIAQEHLKFKDLTSEEFLQQASISTSTGNNPRTTNNNGNFSSFFPQETSSSTSTNRTNQIKYKTNSNSSSSKRQIDPSADGKFSRKILECETDGPSITPFHYSLDGGGRMVETEKIQLENSEGQASRLSSRATGKIGQYSLYPQQKDDNHENQPTNSSSNSSLSSIYDEKESPRNYDRDPESYSKNRRKNHHSKSLDSESPFHKNNSNRNRYSTNSNRTSNGYHTTERCNSNGTDEYDFHSPKSVLDLLRSINLEKYTSLLIGHGFESIELFQELEEEDLDQLEIQNQIVRTKLLDTVKRIRENSSRSADTPSFLIIPTYSCPSQMNLLQEQQGQQNHVMDHHHHLNQIIEPPPDFNLSERENPKKLEIRQGIIRAIEPLDDHVEELILSPSNLSINQINPIDSQVLIRRNQRMNFRSFNGNSRYVNINDGDGSVPVQHSKSSSEPSPSGNENSSSSSSQNHSLLNELKNQALLCDKSSDSGISVGANSPPPTN